MAKLVRYIIILIIITTGIALLAKHFLAPFAWGDQTQYTKIDYFNKNGLYTVQQNSDKDFVVVQTKTTETQYIADKKNVKELKNSGLSK